MLANDLRTAEAVEYTSAEGLAEVKEKIARAMSINIQNVSEYLHNELKKEVFKKDDFSNVAPPFQMIWMEFKAPDGVPIGVLLQEKRIEEIPLEVRPKTPGKWACLSQVFANTHGRLVSLGGLIYVVDALGNMLELPGGKDYAAWTRLPIADTEEGKQAAAGMLHSAMFAPWLALSFMHCKNVKVEVGPQIPAALQKARRARGKPPLIRYSTIRIEPFRDKEAGMNGHEGGRGAKALHICRGHFARYGAAWGTKPLFGRIEGQFWMPAHVRGTSAAGVVKQDYEVAP